ncbi:glycosyltransferase [Cohnella lubricantis]|uniref:Glycosyltransferase n=1 Tax=Cohnella lubricantis TaxID=2163172 RepID=A0A841T689_9BACL|nr:glycosyltransferase [Cohnella lubricantis]MBB6676844.1 glycosyltransferase [Cohnella lubricantis]MBP2119424.1 glycosyltransferase involved in cell wall biosynthesis [Cohnella lubricantis]
MNPNLRVAIVHDYLNQMGGAERVVAVLHRLFPSAPIYTTIVDRERLLAELQDADIRTTWMQRIPGILKRFKQFFWLYPLAVRSINLSDYDLVISSSSAYAIGAPVKTGAVHVCYCHTPMRFAWDFSAYMEGMRLPALLKGLAKGLTLLLRIWDRTVARDVDLLIANSSVVRERVQACYGRESKLVYPPVDVSRFSVSSLPSEDYYLVVSRLVSYKRIDLAVKACSELGVPLLVVGDGPDGDRLQSFAGGTVKFLGRLPDEQVVQYMQRCRALLFPGLEDFGITPLEANACGRPVIAYRGGGALDTIVPGLNGVFFDHQDAGSLADTLRAFEGYSWDPEAIREHAMQYDGSVFAESLLRSIRQALSKKDGLEAVDAELKRERAYEVKL